MKSNIVEIISQSLLATYFTLLRAGSKPDFRACLSEELGKFFIPLDSFEAMSGLVLRRCRGRFVNQAEAQKCHDLFIQKRLAGRDVTAAKKEAFEELGVPEVFREEMEHLMFPGRQFFYAQRSNVIPIDDWKRNAANDPPD